MVEKLEEIKGIRLSKETARKTIINNFKQQSRGYTPGLLVIDLDRIT